MINNRIFQLNNPPVFRSNLLLQHLRLPNRIDPLHILNLILQPLLLKLHIVKLCLFYDQFLIQFFNFGKEDFYFILLVLEVNRVRGSCEGLDELCFQGG